MKTTSPQGLPYPTSLDLGAGARQMQDLAETLEAKMNAVDAGWTLRRNPPTWIASTSVNQNTSIDPLTWHVVDFDNTGMLAPINSGSATTGKLTATAGKTELWWIGAYCQLSQAGSLGDFRRIRLLVITLEPVTAARTIYTIDQTHYETQTTNEHLCLDGLVRVGADATVQLFSPTSAAQIVAGATLWATRIGQE